MPEIRIDPLSGLRAIVATGHVAAWPGRLPAPPFGDAVDGEAAATAAGAIDPAGDPFAEGNEDRTPPELHALRPGGGAADTPGWTVRVVPLAGLQHGDHAAAPSRDAHPHLFTALPARADHEVIVNGPQPVGSLSELPVEQAQAAIGVWRERMRAHGATYRHLVVDERAEAGASRAHTHARLCALDFVPAIVARERERFSAHATRTMGGNLLDDLVQEEVRRRERIVAIDDEAVLMCPYASRMPFALMLVPRRRRERFEDEGPTGARLLHDGLSRLRRRFGASPPLSLWVRTAPRDADRFCWHIDVMPRLTPIGGLELGTGVHVNPVAPERAAAELRDA